MELALRLTHTFFFAIENGVTRCVDGRLVPGVYKGEGLQSQAEDTVHSCTVGAGRRAGPQKSEEPVELALGSRCCLQCSPFQTSVPLDTRLDT